MAAIKSTDLDFDQIKASLKTYFESQSEFSDYNFEASGLSNVLDVLAYNTHMNGLIANMAVNESFLTTSQLRSSVVSHAEVLGYNVRSKTAAKAVLNLSVVTSDTETTTFVLPKNATFTTTIDEVSYSFQTLEDYIATNDGSGTFVLKTSSGSSSIPVYEGILKTKTYIVGDTEDEQVYVIPDSTLDTSTLTITVYDTTTSATFATYTDINNNVRINPESTVYIIRETPNNFYELIFSDGNVLGKSPVAGNKIIVTYLSTLGDAANGGLNFTADEQVTINSVNYNLTVTTTNSSAGGADPESISSIKLNAPRAFATQQRLVTAEDYKALILQRYSSLVNDVAAWGGNDNEPPIYGRVYVSLKFKDGIDLPTQQATKDGIVALLSKNLAIMSIDTYFTDPTNSYLELITEFNFDPDQTGLTAQTIETQVQGIVNSYISTNLNRFNGVFRRSNLLAQVDDFSPAILNSKMSVKIQQRFTPTLNIIKDYTLPFPVSIAIPDDVVHTITSSRFTYNNTTCIIRNKLNENKLQIVSATTGAIESDNIGTYNTARGLVSLRGFTCSAFEGSVIKISVIPANQSTVRPLRNYILTVDSSKSTAKAIIDYQNTAVTL